MSVYLFDSYAVLKLFQKEKGHEKIVRLLKRAQKTRSRPCLQILNLGEVLYIIKKRFGDELKVQALAHIFSLGLEIISIDDQLVLEAAELKGTYAMSYADCFALATAIRLKATLVTGDPEFRVVTKLIPIYWID